MSSPSNLYAEKVFSEHPIGLWALDDRVDYIDLLSNENKMVDLWGIDGGSVSLDLTNTTYPIKALDPYLISKNSDANIVELVSNDILHFYDLDQNLKTFCFGGYFYTDSNSLSSIEIGYEYFDTTTGTNVQQLKKFIPKINSQWMFLSETFQILDEHTTFRLIIKATFLSIPDITDTQSFIVNGITLGQWSEEFNSSSIGVTGTTLPDISIFDQSDTGIPANAYGIDADNGYYIISNNSLKAKNTGVPLVYGASGVTKLLPNDWKPSLILPGKGFLHEYGKHKTYTFEMWIRLLNDSTEPKKIFGPVTSADGLFVDGQFLILKINDYIGSHYVGEWGKPMLLDIRYSPSGASLLINGDTAIELVFNSNDLSFASDGNLDWLGFYAHNDVFPVEIDCVGIYSYQVANVVAKRRFVYGQAVEFPENINTSYSGTSIFVDYNFANYTNNYVYPDLGKWNHGVRNNVSITNNILSTIDYSLPRTVIKGNGLEQFNSFNFSNSYQNQEVDTSFTFSEEDGYLIFDDLNFLQEDLHSFYAVIKPTEIVTNDEVVLNIESDSTNNYFSIVLGSGSIKYNLFYNGILKTIYTGLGFQVGEVFPVGINIPKFTEYFGQDVSSFFGNRSDLRFYVGGTSNFDKSFKGKFYKVGFANAANSVEIDELFNERGCVLEYEDVFNMYSDYVDFDAGVYTGTDQTFWKYLLDGGSPSDYTSYRLTDHIASYTLFVKNYMGKYYFDVAVNGYWKDYIPLTSLAKYVTNQDGDSYYDLDFIQFNIDYPAPSKFLETDVPGTGWYYGVPKEVDGVVIPSLQEEFSGVEQKTYFDLDNQLYTGYNDYTDLKNKTSKIYTYDTSSSMVRSYIMFEYIESGLSISDAYFSNIVNTPKDGVISPGSEWLNTKYEVVDGTILYPPEENINALAMVSKIEFKVDGVLTHKIKVRSLEYAAQSFDEVSPNAIGTKFGENIYPYKKNGYYFDYKGKNPFSIYKKGSPYLYLTNNSGISLKGQYSPKIQRGLSIPVNKTMSDNFNITVMQIAMRYDKDFFPYAPMQIFEIESPISHIKFFAIANSSSGDRAKIYAINAKTGKLENGILFHLNGKVISNPVITVKEWAFLGIQFANMPNFSNHVGSINLTAPFTYNSISYYKATALQEIQQVATRPWVKIKYNGATPLDWSFWYDDPIHSFQWGDILYVSTVAYYGINSEKIYANYMGTNKTIVDLGTSIELGSFGFNVYKDITWQQITVTPV